MRILFATTQSYLPQRVGGSQLSTHDLALALSAIGHQAAVLCDLYHPPLDWTRIQNRVIARVLRRTHPCDRWWPYRVYRGYDATTGVHEVARAFQPDLAIVQAGRPVPLVNALLERDVRTILYFRDVQFDALGGSIPTHHKLRFVANSRFTASRVAAAFGIEAPAIPPLVRTHAYRTPGDGGHVLFINPDPRKGLDIALALARMNPDIPFVFLESWPRSPRHIAALTATLRAHPNVVFRRATLNMAEQYARARLLIVPSVWEEPWGRVVTEAHASGIPVIAAAIGGLPESVGPGGILVRPGSPIEVWSHHLRSLWTSHPLYARYRQRALDHSLRDEIQPERVLRRLLDVVAGSW